MATKQITTWEELKTAFTETISETTTYYITNDIEMSSELIEEQVNITGGSSSARKIFTTIDDSLDNAVAINGLTAYNIMTGNRQCVFWITGWVTFRNIKFTNFQCENYAFIAYNDSWVNAVKILLDSCTFNGNCRYLTHNYKPGSSGGGQVSTSFNIIHSAINVKCGSLHTLTGSTTDAACYFGCWIHVEQMSTSYANVAYYAVFYYCYLEGVTVRNITSSSSDYYIFGSCNLYNCCVNIELNNIGTSTGRYSYVNYNSVTYSSSYSSSFTYHIGTQYSIFNSSKFTNAKIPTTSTYMVGISDNDIKDVSKIQEVAPNFPITE